MSRGSIRGTCAGASRKFSAGAIVANVRIPLKEHHARQRLAAPAFHSQLHLLAPTGFVFYTKASCDAHRTTRDTLLLRPDSVSLEDLAVLTCLL